MLLLLLLLLLLLFSRHRARLSRLDGVCDVTGLVLCLCSGAAADRKRRASDGCEEERVPWVRRDLEKSKRDLEPIKPCCCLLFRARCSVLVRPYRVKASTLFQGRQHRPTLNVIHCRDVCCRYQAYFLGLHTDTGHLDSDLLHGEHASDLSLL